MEPRLEVGDCPGKVTSMIVICIRKEKLQTDHIAGGLGGAVV